MPAFGQIFEQSYFHDVPSDWWVVLTDVQGSTKAIEAGRYKDVNSAGSLAVIALANLLGHMDFPFCFGGDGVTCLVSGDQAELARGVLAGVGPVVRQAFELSLRQTMIPVSELYRRGFSLKLAKLQVSPQYAQAVLDGDALDEAERIMKRSEPGYQVSDGGPEAIEPDLTGYSCRWQDFPSPRDETLALIVKFRLQNPEYLHRFLKAVEAEVGGPETHHPLRLEASKPVWSTPGLNREVRVLTGADRGAMAVWTRLGIRAQILGTLFCGAVGLRFRMGKKDISAVRQDNIRSSDYRKYDNSLKMVLAVSRQARVRLQRLLAKEAEAERLYFGLHITDRAMLTCLLKTQTGQEVHFVDAADGGYAMAAKHLKAQMAEAAGLAGN